MSTSDVNKTISTPNRVASARKQNYQNFKPKKSFVSQLPFWQRYRRGVIFGGAFLTFCLVYSAPIYYFLREPPEYVDPRSTMWPSEIASGKTKVQQFRERIQREKDEKDNRDAKLELMKAKMAESVRNRN